MDDIETVGEDSMLQVLLWRCKVSLVGDGVKTNRTDRDVFIGKLKATAQSLATVIKVVQRV